MRWQCAGSCLLGYAGCCGNACAGRNVESKYAACLADLRIQPRAPAPGHLPHQTLQSIDFCMTCDILEARGLFQMTSDVHEGRCQLAGMCAGDDSKNCLAAAAAAARSGADGTKGMKASKGRSSYVPEDVLSSVPDPGAQGVAIWLQAIADSARQPQ